MTIEESRYPQGVPFSINYPEIPLYTFLENTARKYPKREAIFFYQKKINYAQLWDDTGRLAAALKRLGLQKGDRVGLLMPNIPQFIIAFYGSLLAGGIVVAINPLNPVEEVERELKKTDTKIIVVLDRFINKITEADGRKIIVSKVDAYLPTHIKIISHLRQKRIKCPKKALKFERLVRGVPLKEREEINAREDLAVIQYTGGTTGHPKGVMLTHFNLVANALQSYFWLRGWGYSEKPHRAGWPFVVCATPFFHIYGMTVAMNGNINFGSTLLLIPNPEPESIMKVIQKYSATHFPAIPQMISDIIEHPRRNRYNLRSLTSCVSGGAPIKASMVDKFVSLTGAHFYKGYGLTEAGPVTHCTHLNGYSKPRSVGLPFPDTDAKIVDLQKGEVELQADEEGELIVRGPQVMVGYWGDIDATSRALKEEWLYTGDVAQIDRDGYLYIIDRKQERIIHAGHNIWPSELEEIIESHPIVKSAVIFGEPDLLSCATNIKAVITITPKNDVNEVEKRLMEFCKLHLKSYQVPSQIVVLNSFPKTPLGKIDRYALKQVLSA